MFAFILLIGRNKTGLTDATSASSSPRCDIDFIRHFAMRVCLVGKLRGGSREFTLVSRVMRWTWCDPARFPLLALARIGLSSSINRPVERRYTQTSSSAGGEHLNVD